MVHVANSFSGYEAGNGSTVDGAPTRLSISVAPWRFARRTRPCSTAPQSDNLREWLFLALAPRSRMPNCRSAEI